MSDMTDLSTSATRATSSTPLQATTSGGRSLMNEKEMTTDKSRQPHSAALKHLPGAYEGAPGGVKESEVGDHDEHHEHGTYPRFAGDRPWGKRSWWYELIPFRGMYYDLRRRLPYLASDWTTAFLPHNWWTITQYVVRMYFINLMPAISYVLDMNHRTNGAYGINEVILASALAAIVFPIFSIQPLTFVGVTGLINLVNYTQYDIVVGYYGLDQMDYLRVQAWSLIWAAGFHFVVAVFNLCDFTRFITDMTSQTFGFYVGIVYIQKGIELLILEYEPAPLDNATGWLSVTIAILFTVSVYLVSKVGSTSFLPFRIRYFVSSFAFAAGVIFWTGFSNFPDYSLRRVPLERLPITRSFFPTMDRPWFIDFWNIELRWVFVGAPLGFLIMLLFYFDHNVSSVMAQSRAFPVKRPAGFHWDFFLLGITTLVSGFLGLPAPNGLVPQCPWSTESLSVFKQVDKPRNDEEERPLIGPQGKRYVRQHIVNTRVVENRVGHLIVGLLTIGTMTRPLLVALGTMPRAIFAGIFILVGWSSIEGNVITTRTLAIFKDRRLSSPDDPLLKVRRMKIALFVGIQWVFFGLTIAISQTIAAIGFPVIVVLLIPFRFWVVPLWFSPAELRVLDAPTADADVVLASIGHETEAVTGQGQRVARDTKIAGTKWNEDDEEHYDDKGGHAVRAADDASDGCGTDTQFGTLSHNPHVKGYTIGSGDDVDDDDDDDLGHGPGMSSAEASKLNLPYSQRRKAGAVTPDVDPDGNYLAWLSGSVDNAAGETSPNPDAYTDKPVPLKEAKRSKSVTQSWWGPGGDLAPVERAPTPHTPATPVGGADESVPATSGQAPMSSTHEAPLVASAPNVGGAGLKKWFSSKRKPTPRDDAQPGRGQTQEGSNTNADNVAETARPHSPFVASPAVSSHGDQSASAEAVLDRSLGNAHAVPPPVTTEVEKSQVPSTPDAVPTTMEAIDNSIAQAEGANLFLGGGLSPSEAGARAAGAVREIQSNDNVPVHHSMIPNMSDTPGSTVHSSAHDQSALLSQDAHGASLMSAVKDAIPSAEPNASAVVAAVNEHTAAKTSGSIASPPDVPSEAKANESGQPDATNSTPMSAAPALTDVAGEQDMAEKTKMDDKLAKTQENAGADKDALKKDKKDLEKAKTKESKADAKRRQKEDKQKHKAEARQRKEDAKRQKEEEALQSLLAKQAKTKAESEAKRQKLEEQIKNLEGLAHVQSATNQPPPQVSKASLVALSHQVAGHEAAVMSVAGGQFVVKPCLPGEAEFYQTALVQRPPTMSKSQAAQLGRLIKYLPTYHGTVDVADGTELKRAVILENLTRGYEHANVLDIKLGKQLWDEQATQEKRDRMDEVASTTTSGSTGIRLTGWQIWNSSSNGYVKVDKAFGKGIKVDQLDSGVRSFFGLGTEDDSKIVSGFVNDPVPNVHLPTKSVERLINDAILPSLTEIIDTTKKLDWRVRGGSLLIVYEGDAATLEKGVNPTILRCGRSSSQRDQIVDVNKLDTPTADPTQPRLADIRLIDFAHATFTPGKGPDEGYLAGLETTRKLLEKLAKDARKGKIGPKALGATSAVAAEKGVSPYKQSEASVETSKATDPQNEAVQNRKASDIATPQPELGSAKSSPVAAGSPEASRDGQMKGSEALPAAPVAAPTSSKKEQASPDPQQSKDKPRRFASLFRRKENTPQGKEGEESLSSTAGTDKHAVLPVPHESSTESTLGAPKALELSVHDKGATAGGPDTSATSVPTAALGLGPTIGAGSVLLASAENNDNAVNALETKAMDDRNNDTTEREVTMPPAMPSNTAVESANNGELHEGTDAVQANDQPQFPASAPNTEDLRSAEGVQDGERRIVDGKQSDTRAGGVEEVAAADAAGLGGNALASASSSSNAAKRTKGTDDKEAKGLDNKENARDGKKELRKETSDTNLERRKSRFSGLFSSPSKRSTNRTTAVATHPPKSNKQVAEGSAGPTVAGTPADGAVNTLAPDELQKQAQSDHKPGSHRQGGGIAALFGPLLKSEEQAHESTALKSKGADSTSPQPSAPESTLERPKDKTVTKRTSRIGLLGLKKKSEKDDVKATKAGPKPPLHDSTAPAIPPKSEAQSEAKEDAKPTKEHDVERKADETTVTTGVGAAAVAAAPVIAHASKTSDEKQTTEGRPDVPEKASPTAGTETEKAAGPQEETEGTGIFGLRRKKTKKDKPAALDKEQETIRKEAERAHEEAQKAKAEAEKARAEAKKAKEEAEKAKAEAEKARTERAKAERVKSEAAEKSKREQELAEKVAKASETKQSKATPAIGSEIGSKAATNGADASAIDAPAAAATAASSPEKTPKRKSGLGFLGLSKKMDESKSLPEVPASKQDAKVDERLTSSAEHPAGNGNSLSNHKSVSKKTEADGSALDTQIPPEILAAIETGEQPADTPRKSSVPGSFKRSSVDRRRGKEKDVPPIPATGINTSMISAPVTPSKTSAKADQQPQGKLTSFWKLGGNKAADNSTAGSQAGRQHAGAIVEEVIEETKDGARKFIRVTNPPRGAGRAVSAVQWREP